jgi:hypothetical protein
LLFVLTVNSNSDIEGSSPISDNKTTMKNPKRKHDNRSEEQGSSLKFVRKSSSTELEGGDSDTALPSIRPSLPHISTSTSAQSLSSTTISSPTGEELLSSLDPLFQCYNIYDMEAFYQLLSHHCDPNLILTLKYLNYTVEGINPVFVFCNISHECYPDATLKILERRIVNLSTSSASTPTTPLDLMSSASSPEAGVTANKHSSNGKSKVLPVLVSSASSSSSNKIVRIEYICKFNGTIISNQEISVIYQQFLRHTEDSLASSTTTAATSTPHGTAADTVPSPPIANGSDKGTSEDSSPEVAPAKTNTKKKGRKKGSKAEATEGSAKLESSSLTEGQKQQHSQLYANGLKHINQMKLDDLSMNLARFISQNYLVMNMNDNPTRQSTSYIFELVLTFNPVTNKVFRCDMDILAKTDVVVAQTVLPPQIAQKSSKNPPASSGQSEK